MADRGGYHSSIFARNCASSGNGALSLDTTPSQLAPVDSVRYRRWQKDNSPRPQIIERAGYLPSSTHRQDTDQFEYVNALDPITRGGAISASNPLLRGRSVVPVVKGLSCKRVHVGSRALQLGRKWVHYLGIILNSSVQGSLNRHGHINATRRL